MNVKHRIKVVKLEINIVIHLEWKKKILDFSLYSVTCYKLERVFAEEMAN